MSEQIRGIWGAADDAPDTDEAVWQGPLSWLAVQQRLAREADRAADEARAEFLGQRGEQP